MAETYPQIIRLARSGSLERAWSLMEQHGLLHSDTDPRALTLQARLVKDRAKRADGAERARLFGESAVLYAKAGAIDGASYPLINAAALSLLAGQRGQSERMAREVLAALDANPDEAETPYWLGATRAEALLLLGQPVEARAALRNAISRQPAAWEDHAATIGQFELLCAELDEDNAWLDQMRPPKTLQFAGLMSVGQDDPVTREQIDAFLERENIGFGFGALAAGADIWIAEAILERGGDVHIVLPCSEAAFRAHSVRLIDPAWEPRFEAVLGQAASFECLDYAGMPDPSAVARGEVVSLGMAMSRASQLQTDCRRLRVIGEMDDAPASADVEEIRAARKEPRDAGRPVPELKALVLTGEKERTFGNVGEAWLAAREAGRAAIDYVPASAAGAQRVSDRLNAMFECSGKGQIHASREAAYSLLASGADVHIESAGEMRWAGGIDPLYFIT